MGAPGGVISIGAGGGSRAAVAAPNEVEGSWHGWEGAPTDPTSLGNTMQRVDAGVTEDELLLPCHRGHGAPTTITTVPTCLILPPGLLLLHALKLVCMRFQTSGQITYP